MNKNVVEYARQHAGGKRGFDRGREYTASLPKRIFAARIF